jgi:hypothetical protein
MKKVKKTTRNFKGRDGRESGENHKYNKINYERKFDQEIRGTREKNQ